MEQHETVRKISQANQTTEKIFLKQMSDYDERSINKGQSIYDEMSHNVVNLFSIYDEMTHNVVYLFSNPNFGNHQADMRISPLALNLDIKFLS